MKSGLVSVCIPCYNVAKYINQTIDCLLDQTYNEIEIIIQDDCSNDGTFELINKLYKENKKVQIFKNETNLGIGGNWNAAFEHAKGQYTIIFNADDLIVPSFIEESLSIFELSPLTNFVTTDYVIMLNDDKSQIKRIDVRADFHSGTITDFAKLHFETGMPFSHVFTVHKTAMLNELKLHNKGRLFDERQTCDAELWTRIGFADYQGYYLKKELGYYRKHETNNSSRTGSEFKSSVENIEKHAANYIARFGKAALRKKVQKMIVPYIKSHIRKLKFPEPVYVIRLIKLII